jgi:hypothetical protein
MTIKKQPTTIRYHNTYIDFFIKEKNISLKNHIKNLAISNTIQFTLQHKAHDFSGKIMAFGNQNRLQLPATSWTYGS